MRRALRINRKDGTYHDLEISDVISLKDNNGTMPIVFNVDKSKKEGYRLTFNSFLIPDFTQILNIEVIRED